VIKIPENDLKEELFILAQGFSGVCPSWQAGFSRAQQSCSPHGSQEAERGMIWGPEIPFKVMPPVTYFL
jgi:hypothetical protein